MRQDGQAALPSQSEWEALSARCLLRDRHWLRRHYREVSRHSDHPLRAKWCQRLERSLALYEARLAQVPRPAFNTGLPVEEARDLIAKTIAENQITLICGETGSGKTTVIPQICLSIGRGVAGMIACTQPRRLAARTVSARLASELGSELGAHVGFKIRFTDRTSERSYIKVMTDGVLLAEIHDDRFLNAYDTIIIDEAHERSLNIDFLMGYCLTLAKRRPDLKIILTSATMEAERLAAHLGGVPILEVSGRTYPVEVRYLEPALEEESEEEAGAHELVQAVDQLSQLSNDGDILVFLPGEREIREALDLLKPRFPSWELLPLFARLSVQDQDRVFHNRQGRRIVLATNVAETSITVPGIRYVIDTGLARVKRYSPRTKVTLLQVEKISQAAARQRAGRCGRLMDGVCLRLYSELDFNARPEFTTPEILRSSLAGVILRMEALELGHVETFPFLDPPSPRMIEDGYQLLHELGAVEATKALTPLGREMARFPVDPRIARMILAGREYRALKEVLIIAAFLSIQDPRERPMEHRQAADEKHKVFAQEHSDFMGWLALWSFFDEASERLTRRKLQTLCRDHFLSYMRMREWRDVHAQLTELVSDLKVPINQLAASYEELHCALLSGLLGQVGLKDPEKEEYQGPRGIRFQLAPGSLNGKIKPKWIMSAELAETTKLYARGIARIEPDWIEKAAHHLTRRTLMDPIWDRKAAQASTHEQISLYGLIIVGRRRIRMGPHDPVEARKLFIRHALVAGEWESRAGFFQHNQALVKEVESLEHKARRQDVLVDEAVLCQFYDARLPPEAWSGERFERWRREAEAREPKLLYMERSELMRHAAESVTADLFPVSFSVGAHDYPLSYRFEPGHPLDGVTLSLPVMALGQIREEAVSWLVPGMVREKIQWLLKSLPQRIRRHFVPLPNAVTDFLTVTVSGEETLEAALKRYVEARTEALPIEFKWPPLNPHHYLNIRLLDEREHEIGMSRDLTHLKESFARHARAALSQAFEPALPDTEVNAWSWDALPEQRDIERQGRVYTAYPTLVIESGLVHLKLMEDLGAAKSHMAEGLVGLLGLTLQSEIKQVLKQSPDLKAITLQFVSLPWHGDELQQAADVLRQDLMDRVLHECLPADPWQLRTRQAWQALQETTRRQLASTLLKLTRRLVEVFEAYQDIREGSKALTAHHFKPTLREVEAHLSVLLGPHWIRRYSLVRLEQLPRYLKAVASRLKRLPNQWQTDGEKSEEIRRLSERLAEARKKYGDLSELDAFYWAIEELRVSLFAQELKTAFPVSVKRLDKDWVEIQKRLSPLK